MNKKENSTYEILEEVITLDNGRIYKIIDQGEYKGGEYPSGGYKILTWDDRLDSGKGNWMYVDNAPYKECLDNFIKAAKKLPKIENSITFKDFYNKIDEIKVEAWNNGYKEGKED